MNKLLFNASVFRILIFTDLHYGESDIADNKSNVFQEHMLDLEKPDFVVFNGDMSSEYAITGDNLTWWTTQWRRYTSVVRLKQIPYALNIGNHDVVADSGMDILEYDKIHGYPWSYTTASLVQEIPIYASQNGTNTIAYYIWIVSPDVDIAHLTEWSSNSNKTHGQMFIHIPLSQALSLTNKQGIHNEFISCSSGSNDKMIKIIMSVQNVDCIWHGHDHMNNYFGYVNQQCFGSARKSGYGGYNGLTPGVSVIDLVDNGRSWKSHVRLSDSSILDLDGYTANIWVHLQVSCDISLKTTVVVILASIVFKLVGLFFLYFIRTKIRKHGYTRVSSSSL